MVKVKFFGWAKDLAGTTHWQCEIPASIGVRDMWRLLTAAYPALAPHAATFALAVNREYAAADTSIAPDAEVAVIPPVSGG